MRETTSSDGAASSSGSLNGCTPSATPETSSNNRCNSAFGTVGTNETPSTSSRASTSAQPAFDIVVGNSNFFLLIPVVLIAIGRSLFDVVSRPYRVAGLLSTSAVLVLPERSVPAALCSLPRRFLPPMSAPTRKLMGPSAVTTCPRPAA